MTVFHPQQPETVFTYGAPGLKFGVGARLELGHDLSQLEARRVLLVTDPGVAATGAPDQIAEVIRAASIETIVYDRSRVEPTDGSLEEAIAFARAEGPFDAIVAVGGGSSIDTAKAVNLLVTNEGELLDYVNAPVGKARAPKNALLPLIAVPTTTGTGSESTTICVLDVVSQHVKTGISHARLRPTAAVVDPELTLTQPAGVTAAAGLDILCHALESYTARPFTSYEHKQAGERVPYCGSNPIADMWSEKALTLMAASFRTAVRDGGDLDARIDVSMAATFAGLGFGNAGVHVPHANAYPIAGQVRDFRPEGYNADHAMIPHGMAVSLTAPAAFRFTFEAAPERHVRAAELLAPGATRPDDLADFLPQVLAGIMRDVGIPSGISEVGFTEGDIDSLVEGTMKQQRLLATAPREVTEDDIANILGDSLEIW
ncbi:hydroxyacid-oxoacid transhydrogenase [Aeromicrobium wangtongii]|uniref:hydroxyacid-oxoacid transhydrogenase n=1 Tax=Aeromicrobium wangtongii TaxID=2969247 RepID=A0ABY5M951_9ACTN|nr:hydroxyacid-oxoacid transhydrogenase [Aeromicrobium wangtongii]MCD9198775.1 iron-containing alcohol dehydrogenase [Aeromicrobium wangtongii]UUP13183.1 iron-containing alcohol dehydrogenase [Aeromicrobium wangtongii]